MSSDSAQHEAAWRQILALIEEADTIAISGHTGPDGDALGSGLGLGLALRHRYPNKDITCLLADVAPVPRVYRFMVGADEMVPAKSYAKDPDLFISVDVPTVARLNDSAAVMERSRHVATIDHHPARGEFAEVVVREISAAATAVLIDEFLSYAHIEMPPAVASCLLTGLVTDTGRFQYQNANPEAFECAARLVNAGAEPSRIALEVYQNQRLAYLQLESIVMGRIQTTAGGLVAYSYAFARDLSTCGVGADECDGLVDVVRSVQGTEVCLFLRETDPVAGTIRGNLRSKGMLDVSTIASDFGGGGHAAAAGFTYTGTIDAALHDLIPRLAQLVGRPVA